MLVWNTHLNSYVLDQILLSTPMGVDNHSLILLRKNFMKGHGLVQCYFPSTAQRYYNQILAFKNKFGLRVGQAFCES